MTSTLIITRQCNFTCGHCMMSAGPHPAHMDEKTFTRALELTKGHRVRLFGGEPTLHPLFPQYIRQAAESAAELALFTNGSTLRRKRVLDAISQTAHDLGSKRFGITVSNSMWHRQFITRRRFDDNIRILTKQLPGGMEPFIEQDTEAYPIGRASLNLKYMPLVQCDTRTTGQKMPCEEKDAPPDIDIDGSAYQCMFQKHTFLGNVNDTPPGGIKDKARKSRGSYKKGSSCDSCINTTAPHGTPQPEEPYRGEPYVPHLPTVQIFRAARRMAEKSIAEMAAIMGITPLVMRGFDLHGDRLPNATLMKACPILHINPEFILEPYDTSPFNLPRNPMAFFLKPNVIEEVLIDLCGATDAPQVFMTVPWNEHHCSAIACRDKFKNIVVLLPKQPERGYAPLYHQSIASSLRHNIWNHRKSIPETIMLAAINGHEPFPSAEAAEAYFHEFI